MSEEETIDDTKQGQNDDNAQAQEASNKAKPQLLTTIQEENSNQDLLISPLVSPAIGFKKTNQTLLPIFHGVTGSGTGGIGQGSGNSGTGDGVAKNGGVRSTGGGFGSSDGFRGNSGAPPSGDFDSSGGAAHGGGFGGSSGAAPGRGAATSETGGNGVAPGGFRGDGGGVEGSPVTSYDPYIVELEACRKKMHKTDQYIKLKRDEDWPRWLIKFKRQAREDAYKRVLGRSKQFHLCSLGADQDLWKLQLNFFAMVLEFCLETSIGQFYVTTYIDVNARTVWFSVKDHYFTSTAALHASNDILTKLQNLNIATFTKFQDFLTNVQELIQRYDQINPKDPMSVHLKINTLQNAVSKEIMLTNS